MKISDKLKDLQRWDERRPGFPGEHSLALGAGLLVMRRAGRSRSLVGRMLGRTLGTALLARAATGRDGPLGKRAPTPTDRVRDLLAQRAR
ncbi:hypothetical protein [Acidovorax sp. SRB_24]|uniref:hypothetical protein n=1 Tax=Acidovorax sp. SRB_24 TaxID=1962700 RepID=UPI00145EC954|nr:hypothetical protein [Acidovorax sp. SRB_24]NMM75749.1 hypothetical protein [Acidovorax sp. SRB_24]